MPMPTRPTEANGPPRFRSSQPGVGVQPSAGQSAPPDDIGFERRMIAQTLVAPGVVVEAARRLQLGRGEQVVEAPAARMTRNALPGPARLRGSVAVKRAIG